MTTTGAQRKPGVQVRLVAESPKASKCSHLNPRFKVVFAGIAMAEDVFFRGLAAVGRELRRACRCMSIDRVALRREFREIRRAIPAANRIAAAERLASQLSSLPFVPQRGHVAGYWAMDGEIALHVWQLRLPSATDLLPARAA